MTSILAFGITTQSTTASGIPSSFDQLAPNGATLSTYLSVQQILTNPTFAGITSLTPQLNGSLLAGWSVGTTPNPTLIYDVYIQLGTATGLFVDANRILTTFSLSAPIFSLVSGTLLVYGSTYFVGVRARDPLGNVSTSTASLSAISSGVNPSRVLALTDIQTIVNSVWDEIQSAHTTPSSFGSYLDSKSSLIQADTTSLLSKLGNPVGSTFSADIANIQSGVTLTNTKLGTPTGASVSADIVALQTSSNTLLTRLTAPRAANLDFLDIAISTRLSDSQANTRFTSIDSAVAGILSAVQSIQNNTNFVGIVPAIMNVPDSGSSTYKFFVNLFDDINNPEDPDSQEMNYRIENTAGTVLVSTTAMTRNSIGVYESSYVVASGTIDTDLLFVFTYAENSTSFIQYRLSRVQSVSSDIDTLLARLTPSRAANLDNLDVTVSSRVSDANDLTRYNNLLTEHATTHSAVAAVSTKIGTSVFGSVSADITSVRIQTDKIGSPANTTLAADNAALLTAVNSRQSEASALTRYNNLNANDAAILSAINTIQNNTSFVGIVPNPLEIPNSGSSAFKIFANLFDSSGVPNDPDSNIMNYRIEDTLGGIIVATTPMARITTGQYEATYTVTSTDPIRALIVIFEYIEAGTSYQQIRVTSTGASETKLDTLINRLTQPRAANLDNLNDTVTSRAAQVDIDTLLARLTMLRASNLDNLNAQITSRGSQTDIDTLLARLTSIRAGLLDNLDVPVSTRADAMDIDNALVRANTLELVGIVEDDE